MVNTFELEALGMAGTQDVPEMHGALKDKAVYLASLDVQTAFDVAKPGVVADTLMGAHGRIIAEMLEEMKELKVVASFESCETEFRYSSCTRQGRVEAPRLYMRLAKVFSVERGAKLESSRYGRRGGQRVLVLQHERTTS